MPLLPSAGTLARDFESFKPVEPIDAAFAIVLDRGRSSDERLKALKRLKTAVVGNNARKEQVLSNDAYLQCLLDYTLPNAALLPTTEALEGIQVLGVSFTSRQDLLSRVVYSGILNNLCKLLVQTCFLMTEPASNGNAFEGYTSILVVLRTMRNLLICLAATQHNAFLQNNSQVAANAMDIGDSAVSWADLRRLASESVLESTCVMHLVRLVRLPSADTPKAQKCLKSSIISCASAACIILSQVCIDAQCQIAILAADQEEDGTSEIPVLEGLLALLDTTNGNAIMVEPALGLIQALVTGNAVAASRVQLMMAPSNRLAVDLITGLTDDPKYSIRLAAASCATILYKAVDVERQPLLHLMPHENMKSILKSLVRLLGIPDCETTSVDTISWLVSENTDLQNAACDLGIMQKLEYILKQNKNEMPQPYSSAKHAEHRHNLRNAIFQCIATLSLTNERARKMVIDADLLGYVVGGLSDPSSRTRAAACQCARALSRSVNLLRTYLVDAGAARPLFDLLEDSQEDVQITAVATCANLLIEFSPMKEVLIERNVIAKLVELTRSHNSQLRLNSLSALKNVTYWSDSSLKSLIMTQLGWPYLDSLIEDPNVDIQAQGLSILRNLATAREEDIIFCLHGLGESRCIGLIQVKLNSHSDEVLLQALHTLQHIATSPRGRELIFADSAIFAALMEAFDHTRKDIRLAAVWAVGSLARRESGFRRANENALRLRTLGFEGRLRDMQAKEKTMEVRERVRDAIEAFDILALSVP